jgi:hypothetical protein
MITNHINVTKIKTVLAQPGKAINFNYVDAIPVIQPKAN